MRYILFLFLAVTVFAVDPSNGKKLVFSDDFNADAIDETKWNVFGAREALTLVKGGKDKVLRIGLKQSADMLQWNGVNTKGKFEQTYGYFEVSMRVNAYKGHTGGFHVCPVEEKQVPFADLMWEAVGDDKCWPWSRTANDNGQHDYRPEGTGKQFLKGGEASKKFNTYGVLWTEKSCIWYVNGKQSFKLDKIEVKKPMMLQFNHSVGEWERPGLNLKQLPDDIDIDWVKAWK
jgi:beta-glucanase (GH16 family)